MMNNRAFTLVEMLISLAVASILVLTIGVTSSLSIRSYNQARKEADVYNDLSYGFKMIQNRVRKCSNIALENWTDNQGKEQKLVLDNEAFGVYHDAAAKVNQLVYLKDKDNEALKEVMMSISDQEPFAFSHDIDSSSITVGLDGSKDKIAFNISSTILRRVP